MSHFFCAWAAFLYATFSWFAAVFCSCGDWQNVVLCIFVIVCRLLCRFMFFQIMFGLQHSKSAVSYLATIWRAIMWQSLNYIHHVLIYQPNLYGTVSINSQQKRETADLGVLSWVFPGQDPCSVTDWISLTGFDSSPLVCRDQPLLDIHIRSDHSNQQGGDALFCLGVFFHVHLERKKRHTKKISPGAAAIQRMQRQHHKCVWELQRESNSERDEMKCEGDTGAEMPPSDL